MAREAFVPLAGDFAQWSIVFLDANPGCGARDFGTPTIGGGMSEAIALQELSHNEGMAPLTAPHQCWAFNFHLCTAAAGAVLETLDPESVDVMFPFVTFALRSKVLDRDRDDNHAHPFPYRDLADSPFWEGSAAQRGAAAGPPLAMQILMRISAARAPASEDSGGREEVC